MNKKFYVVTGIIFLMLNLGLAARSQSALDGFDPNANGIVQVVVVQPDGKILIGGDFTIVKGISRNRIARLNPDGTLDNLFDPNSSAYVSSIALQADGKILVGGSFNGVNSIGGQTRSHIARLDGVTGLADSFNPIADAAVGSIALQPDGKILVGGLFSNIGGQTRNRMARLDAVTGLADSFNPAVTGFQVNVILVQPDGKILVGGTFGNIGGQPRSHMARLDPVTGLADSFNPNATAGFFGVIAIALQADGKILAGGIFNSIGGQSRNQIARLDPVTGLADSFNPNPDNIIRTIAVQPDGKILVGGDFTNIGGQIRNRIARLDAVTGLAESFNPDAAASVSSIAVQSDGKILIGGYFVNGIARVETNGLLDRTLDSLSIVGFAVYATAVQPDGKILIGGEFSSVLGVARNNIARLNTDGTLDTAFNPDANDDVHSIAISADGKILVGGIFTNIAGQNRNRIARVDAITGAPDSFNPDANNVVNAIAVQANGKILVGGSFTTIAGQTRNRIARLDPLSGAVDSFNPNANNIVYSLAVQPDGKILAAGVFNGANSIGGQSRDYIARLDAITGAADSFDPNVNNSVMAIAVQEDSKILLGGIFTNIDGFNRPRLARLFSDGSNDSSNPNPNNIVYSIAVQTDGKILAGGGFSLIGYNGGQARNRIARLSAGGATDTFDPSANGSVRSITILPDGKVLAGGPFETIGGQSRSKFARLSNDTAALQNLAVTQTAVTWIRSGSSPELTRVTFESSTDNVNYTFLGIGTVTGSNWTLTGQSLPTGQNIYIRARGFYRGGYYNGSESIQESVRNVYFSPNSTISGTVTYGNAASPPKFISNATVTGTGSPNVFTTTAAPGVTAGQYTLTGFGAGSYTVSLSKTTGQNGISSLDAARIAQHVSGAVFLTTNNQRVTADVSNNGAISSFDAAQIATYVATASSPGLAGQWRFFVAPGPTFPIAGSPISRTYPTVASSIAGEDYIGLLMGDVSGNWNPTAARGTVYSEPGTVNSEDGITSSSIPEKEITVELPSGAVSADKEIVVPVNVQGITDKGVISYEFDLRYDPSVMQPLVNTADLKDTASRGLSVVTNTTEPGLLRVVVYGAYPIEENGVLLNLRFAAVGSAGAISPLSFERIMFNEDEPRVSTTNGRIELF